MKQVKKISTLGVLAILTVVAVPHLSVRAEENSSAASLDDLRASVAALEQEATELEEQNRGLQRMLDEFDDHQIYIVVDTENNRLTLRRDDNVLRTVVVGTGSRQLVEEETGRNWYFETPIGSFTVLGKERNPVWIRPDWSFVEENMPIPPPDDPERVVREVLGKYALLLGNGYKIHGTTFKNLLGTHFTHGCINMDDDDLETVYKAAKVGTKVYIY
jgi:L,D-transpeptidase YbiS